MESNGHDGGENLGKSSEGAALRTAAIGFVAALGIIALGAACGDDTRASGPPAMERPDGKVDGSADALRTEFADKIDRELRALDARIDDLRAKTTNAAADVKAEVDADLDRLRERRDAATQKLRELRSAGADRWADFKSGVSTAVDEIRITIDRTAEKLR